MGDSWSIHERIDRAVEDTGHVCTVTGRSGGSSRDCARVVHRCDVWRMVRQGRKILEIDGWKCRSALGALTDPRREFLDVIEDLAFLRHLAADLAFGVHHRGVVATEGMTDLGQ